MDKRKVDLRKIILTFVWIAFILYCFFNRHTITIDKITEYASKNIFLAVFILLSLFFIKSIVFFIYAGLIFASSGAVLPLPLAILVNVAGVAIMCSVPYFVGKKAGNKMVKSLFEKHPKLKIIKEIQEKNEFLVSFFSRLVGILPVDVVSLYLGASLVSFRKYFLGSLLGFLPSSVSFAVMGMSVRDVTSPAFLISLIFEVLLMITSTLFVWLRKKR